MLKVSSLSAPVISDQAEYLNALNRTDEYYHLVPAIGDFGAAGAEAEVILPSDVVGPGRALTAKSMSFDKRVERPLDGRREVVYVCN